MTRAERWSDEADFLVIGSGAGGATAAVVLAEAGYDVIVFEEGPRVERAEFTANLWRTAHRLFRDGGVFFLRGPSLLPALMGRAVGGSTIINSAICWRLPERVWSEWAQDDPGWAADNPYRALDAHADVLERDLHVGTAPESVMGGNNEALRRGAQALGWQGHAIRRSVVDCRGAALCLQGCPHGAKQSMDVSYLPRAERAGARIVADRRVERVLWSPSGRHSASHSGSTTPTGAEAHGVQVRGPEGPAFRVRARRGVVVAAGAVHTPALLLASRVGRGSPVGRGFQCHPGVSVAARFDTAVDMWTGASQGYEVDEFAARGIKIETVSLAPELLVLRLPGVGARLGRYLDESRHMALWGGMVRARARGRVGRSWSGRPVARYALEPADIDDLAEGFSRSAELAFAAGARAIYPGIHGLPEVMTDMDDVRRFHGRIRSAKQLNLIANHLFGTARTGSDPRRSVVDPRFRIHGFRNAWVADASVLPSNLGVNPQLSIQTLARQAALRVLEAQS